MVLRRVERRDHVSSQIALLITTCSIAQNKATKRFAMKKMRNWGLSYSPSLLMDSKSFKVIFEQNKMNHEQT